jgi:hypothetical protein
VITDQAPHALARTDSGTFLEERYRHEHVQLMPEEAEAAAGAEEGRTNAAHSA